MESVFRAAETLWTGVLVHLWQTTLVLLVLAVLARALREAPARLLAGLWWIGVLKLFLPLSVLGPLVANTLRPVVGNVGSNSASSQDAWVSVTVWLYPQTLRSSVEPSTPVAGMLYVGLTLAWFAGLGWILFRRLRRSKLGAGVPLRADSRRLARLGAKIGTALAPTVVPKEAVVLVEGEGVPAVRGLLRPRIEFPARVAEALEVRDLTAILLHEDEHRRRRDPLRSAPAALVSWLFFFYPPLLWVLRKIYETTEMACDEAVLGFGIGPQAYSRAIARTVALGLEPAYARSGLVGPCRSSIRRRLDRLNTYRRYRTMPRHRLVLATAIVIALVGSVAPLTPGAPDPAESERPAKATVASDRFDALDRLECADQRVTLGFENASIDSVLRVLSDVTTLEPEMQSNIGKQTVTIAVEDVTVREALIELARLAGLSYEVSGSRTLRVQQRLLLAGVDGVSSPRRIEESAIKPVYPEVMRKAHLTGRVILQAVIGATGRVREVEVLSTTQPDYPSLAESAIEALEQWRYEPATLEGEPVSVYFTVVFEFELNENKPVLDPPEESI